MIEPVLLFDYIARQNKIQIPYLPRPSLNNIDEATKLWYDLVVLCGAGSKTESFSLIVEAKPRLKMRCSASDSTDYEIR